ncbi:hypothetical protein C0995_008806, partial [Termitomyces sp. Mi166
MEAFNIAVGVSNIVSCVTGACTLGVYRKNEPCKIVTHLDVSKQQLLTAFDDLAKYAYDLGKNEYQELEKGCNELSDTLDASVTAPTIAKGKYFVRKKKYAKLLEDAQSLETDTYKMIMRIRNQSAAARALNAERQRTTQREGANTSEVQPTQSQSGNDR